MSFSHDLTWVKKTFITPSSITHGKYTNAYLIWAIKELLLYGSDKTKGGANAWTVIGSSNSTAYNMSGTDLWATYENVISSSGNHSWIVLQQAAIGGGSGLQICFDFTDDTTYFDELSIVSSYSAGFTGGALNARPTATDEYVYLNKGTTWGGISTTAPYYKTITRVYSTDGKVSRFLCSHGTGFLFWCMEVLKNTLAHFDENFVFFFTKSVPTRSAMGGSGDSFYFKMDGTECRGRLTLPAMKAGYFVFARSEFQRPDVVGKYNMIPVGVICTTFGKYGKVGDLYDWYDSTTFPAGTYLPSSTEDKGFVSFGDFMFANDGDLLTLI